MRIDKNRELLVRLEELVTQLGCDLQYVDLNTAGGLAVFSGKKRFIINRLLSTEDKIQVLCENLRKMDMENLYLLPALRKRIFGEE